MTEMLGAVRADAALREMQARGCLRCDEPARDIVLRACLLSAGDALERLLTCSPESEWSLASCERDHITAALKASRGDKSRAAKMIGLNRRTFYRRLESLGLSSQIRKRLAA